MPRVSRRARCAQGGRGRLAASQAPRLPAHAVSAAPEAPAAPRRAVCPGLNLVRDVDPLGYISLAARGPGLYKPLGYTRPQPENAALTELVRGRNATETHPTVLWMLPSPFSRRLPCARGGETCVGARQRARRGALAAPV